MNLTAEWSLHVKLQSLDPRVGVFNGLTTYEERKAGMKAVIERLGPNITFTVKDGKNITLSQQYEKVYGINWDSP